MPSLLDQLTPPEKPSLLDQMEPPSGVSLLDQLEQPKEGQRPDSSLDLVSLMRDTSFKADLFDDVKRFARSTGANGGLVIRGVGTLADIVKRRWTEMPDADGKLPAKDNPDDANWLQSLGDFIKDAASESYDTNDARDNSLRSQVAEGAGSLPAIIAGGAAGPPGAIAAYVSMMGESGAEDADASLREQGVTDEAEIQKAKDSAFIANIPVGVLSEAFVGFPALIKSVQAMKGAATPVGRVLTQAGKSFVREAVQEGTEQLASNVIAKDIVGYDQSRSRLEGVAQSALIGGIIGAPVGAAFQGAHEADGAKQAQPEPEVPKVAPEPAAPSPTDEPIDYSAFDTGGGQPSTSTREDNLSEWVNPEAEAKLIPQGFERTSAQADTNKFPVVDFPVNDIVVNKDILQFKEDADPLSGVVEPLEGKFRKPPETTSKPIALWQKLNGEVEVITGRHRLDLAKRSGEETISAQIFLEKDGFTRAMALTFDAESNILDGNGKLKDYAYYFRNSPELTRDEAKSRGLLARIKGASGWHLGRDAGEGLFTAYANGQIAEAKAVAIARGAPGNDAAQASAIKGAGSRTAPELELYARNLNRLAPGGDVQSDQMGFDGISQDFASFEAEAGAVAKVQADKIRENSDLIQAASGASKKPEAARKMGLPVDNPEALKARINELKDINESIRNPDADTFEMLRREAGLEPREAAPAQAMDGLLSKEQAIEQLKEAKTSGDLVALRDDIRASLAKAIQREVGVSEDIALKAAEASQNDSENALRRIEKKLTPEQAEKWEAFWEESVFNKIDGPLAAWNGSRGFEIDQTFSNDSASDLADTVVQAVYKMNPDFMNSPESLLGDVPMTAIIAGKALAEKGTQEDLAKAVDRYTTRNSGSQGDKEWAYVELAKKLGALFDAMNIRLKSGTATNAGELFGDAGFNLSSEEQTAPKAPEANVDNTPSMFGDEVKSTPPTEMDKRNAASRSRGGVEGNIEPSSGAGVGGGLGDPQPRSTTPHPSDDPEAPAFVIELPEIVQLAKALAGGKYPAVLKKLRALKGEALGVFRHTDGEGGTASIQLRADIFQLITKAEKAAMQAEADEYARVIKSLDPEADEKDIAREKYAQLFKDAYELALTKNPVLASKVIAHEIGHWVDWLPDKMISGRGNLLGRIASLKGFTKQLLANKPGAPGELTRADRDRLKREATKLAEAERDASGFNDAEDVAVVSPEEILNIWNNTASRDSDPGLYEFVARLDARQKKELVKAAMRGKISDWFQFRREKMPILTKGEKEYYAELLKEEIRKRQLFALEEMQDQIRPLIAWWRGTQQMEPYFEPSAEMYAETFSILINNPAAVLKRAPLFYKAFFNYLETKPVVKKLYDQIQDGIKSGQIYKDRVTNLRESWVRGDAEGLAADELASAVPIQERLDDARVMFDRIFGPVYRRIKKSGVDGSRAEHAIENFLYRASMHELFLRRLNLDVLGPLTEGGLDWVDLAEFMFHEHVRNNRADIANSQGFNAKASSERLAEMKEQFGPEKWAAVESAQANFRAVYEELVVRRLKDAEVLTPELLKIITDRTFYATMSKVTNASDIPAESIEAAIRNRFGDVVGSRIYKQEGYLGDVKNPATATAQKALSLLSMTYREQAKREIVEFLLTSGDPLVQEAETRFTGQRREPIVVENDRIGTLIYLHKGKALAYYVPRAIYDAFELGNPIDGRIASMLFKVVGPIKAIYTELNYGFWPVATVRDIRGFARKMPKASMLLGDKAIMRYLGPARAAAKASLKGTKSGRADEALARQMLISRSDPRGDRAADSSFERMLLRYGMNPASWRDENLSAGKKLVEVWNWYKSQGQINERMVKIAGMMYLDEHFGRLPDNVQGPQMPEVMKQRLVHESAGSPNFLQRPRAGPTLDLFLLFYNPWKEGLRSEKRAWVRNPGEMLGKFALYAAGATIAAWMLERGLMKGILPDEISDRYQEMYRSIPEYDKTSYHVVPLMWTDKQQGKVLYVRLPLEEGERLLNGVLRKSLTAGEGGEGVLSYAGGQVPGENPVLQVGRAWFTYKVTGRNPYDAFRGREIIRSDEFDAGLGDEAMLKWTSNQIGLGPLVMRFGDESIFEPPPEGVEKFLRRPVVSNLLGRWLKVSNRGLSDEADKVTAPIEKERAAARVLALELVRKSNNGEEFTDAEKQLLLVDTYLFDQYVRKMTDSLTAKSLDAETNIILRARSVEERNALIEAQANRK